MFLNIGIIGDRHVGKSTYISRLKDGIFNHNYNKTNEPKTTSIKFHTKIDFNISFPINIIVTEFPFDGSPIQKQDGYILMFDLLQKDTYDNLDNIYKLYGLEPSDNIVLCGNKCESHIMWQIKPTSIDFHCDKNMGVYIMSAKSNYNYEKPFLYLIRKILKNENICLSNIDDIDFI